MIIRLEENCRKITFSFNGSITVDGTYVKLIDIRKEVACHIYEFIDNTAICFNGNKCDISFNLRYVKIFFDL